MGGDRVQISQISCYFTPPESAASQSNFGSILFLHQRIPYNFQFIYSCGFESDRQSNFTTNVDSKSCDIE